MTAMLQGTVKVLPKWIMTGVLAVGLTTAGIFVGREIVLQPKTPTEIAKLFKVVALYQKSPCKIVYNGNTFEFGKLVDRARHYIVSCYRGEGAQAWAQRYLYRTPDEGKVMYLVFPDGQRRLLRDVFLEELNRLFPA
ncbi:MAG: hypothetical protein HYU34_00430 [Candidatus Omnitrophica bacterium]|nr:hypothetical protein [Candidatus Omnitrophota bacterium]